MASKMATLPPNIRRTYREEEEEETLPFAKVVLLLLPLLRGRFGRPSFRLCEIEEKVEEGRRKEGSSNLWRP